MKRRELTEDEKQEWLEENGQRPKRAAREKDKPAPAKTTSPKKLAPAAPLEYGAPAGLDKKRLSARPAATLDLHGLTQDEAHGDVVEFITRAAACDLRTVLIITGKGRQGGGILRHMVPKWLDTAALRPFILAISYATPKEGGEGALRVLLKKRK